MKLQYDINTEAEKILGLRLHVIIQSRIRFRVNLHSIVA